MDKHLFNLKMAVKTMEREAKRCEKNSKAERTKVKKAMEKGLHENARIHAENAIRNKNQQTQFLRMSARVDAVAQRVQTAVTMRQVTNSMKGVVKSMDAAMKSMNLEQISQLMDKFEKQFEDLDVQVSVMDGAMHSSAVASMPEGQVDSLMAEVAEEHNIAFQEGMSAPQNTALTSQQAEQDELTKRLAEVRNEHS